MDVDGKKRRAAAAGARMTGLPFEAAVFLLACDLGGRQPVEADAGLCEDFKTGMIYMRSAGGEWWEPVFTSRCK